MNNDRVRADAAIVMGFLLARIDHETAAEARGLMACICELAGMDNLKGRVLAYDRLAPVVEAIDKNREFEEGWLPDKIAFAEGLILYVELLARGVDIAQGRDESRGDQLREFAGSLMRWMGLDSGEIDIAVKRAGDGLKEFAGRLAVATMPTENVQ